MYWCVNYEIYLFVVLGVIDLFWEFICVYVLENNIFK